MKDILNINSMINKTAIANSCEKQNKLTFQATIMPALILLIGRIQK